VIEVNDNPSIEQGVEDAFLGDELYMQIMGEFVRRLENRGRLLHNNL
jgi:glutathione synthase/RimK-type ligase-like ATP-grasp enzyme